MNKPAPPRKRTRLWLTIARALGVAYLTLIAMGLFVSESMIFQPPPTGDAAAKGVVHVTSTDGDDIAVLVHRSTESEKVILYSHGNAEDLGHLRGELAALGAHLGVSVVGYDYPGYGASGGTASVEGCYRSIEAVYDYLIDSLGYTPGQVILYGRSVGSGPACHLARKEPVGALILESPFVSAFRVITKVPLLPFDRFPNLRHIRQITCPTLILAGDLDEVIPPWHGRALLAASVASKKRLVVIEGAGHNNLTIVAGAAYYETLADFLKVD